MQNNCQTFFKVTQMYRDMFRHMTGKGNGTAECDPCFGVLVEKPVESKPELVHRFEDSSTLVDVTAFTHLEQLVVEKPKADKVVCPHVYVNSRDCMSFT